MGSCSSRSNKDSVSTPQKLIYNILHDTPSSIVLSDFKGLYSVLIILVGHFLDSTSFLTCFRLLNRSIYRITHDSLSQQYLSIYAGYDLNLKEHEISKKLRDMRNSVPYLTKLIGNISSSYVSPCIFSGFIMLSSIEILNFAKISYSEILQNCPNLKELKVNGFFGSLLKESFQLTTLHCDSLSVSATQLASLFPSLITLKVSYWSYESIHPLNSLKNFTMKIFVIDAGTGETEIFPYLSCFPNLNQLTLLSKFNSVTITPASFKRDFFSLVPKLHTLNLPPDFLLCGKLLENLGQLSSLTSLSLISPDFCQVSPEIFIPLSNLIELKLSSYAAVLEPQAKLFQCLSVLFKLEKFHFTCFNPGEGIAEIFISLLNNWKYLQELNYIDCNWLDIEFVQIFKNHPWKLQKLGFIRCGRLLSSAVFEVINEFNLKQLTIEQCGDLLNYTSSNCYTDSVLVDAVSENKRKQYIQLNPQLSVGLYHKPIFQPIITENKEDGVIPLPSEMQKINKSDRELLLSFAVGDSGSGRRSLLSALHGGQFQHNGADYVNKEPLYLIDQFGGKHYELFYLLAKDIQIYKSLDENLTAFLLCFKLDNRQSIANVEYHWKHEIKALYPNTPIILVGTKVDERKDCARLCMLASNGERVINYSEGYALSQRIGAFGYLETSYDQGQYLQVHHCLVNFYRKKKATKALLKLDK